MTVVPPSSRRVGARFRPRWLSCRLGLSHNPGDFRRTRGEVAVEIDISVQQRYSLSRSVTLGGAAFSMHERRRT